MPPGFATTFEGFAQLKNPHNGKICLLCNKTKTVGGRRLQCALTDQKSTHSNCILNRLENCSFVNKEKTKLLKVSS